MKQFIIPAVCAIACVSAATAVQAQGPYSSKLYYNPPSRYIHVERPVEPIRRDHNHVDAIRDMGFCGEIGRRGLYVENVVPRSAACRAGLNKGDIILRADRHDIDCVHDWECAWRDAGCEMCLTVRRPCGRTSRLHVDTGRGHHNEYRREVRYNEREYRQVNPPRGYSQYDRHDFRAPGYNTPRTGYSVDLGNSGLRIGFNFTR
ncbi:MAG: PDZ domain-containing protein [Rubinisphaera brasiliensis]|uniref:PDZ domain-containing protein n=1 Tax=Rubinisphaera brasiliensis (strain ATCC 49424 / DSM 5305 / JCM 21570 / IAM 15109 / NBRC 103401 / IFAM 1448) TaxID=756272 RepID=F0SJV9_RUBBR|nr:MULTISPECIES: PDZ domain-containing protein [Rubinisphaera]ADY58648.1 hypothetical protein Plabr_1027 [Rubinisphaera brasiliensis DSM 5305]